MIQKIGNPVQGNGSLPASCRSLDNQNSVFRIADNFILLFLDGADYIFQLYISVAA